MSTYQIKETASNNIVFNQNKGKINNNNLGSSLLDTQNKYDSVIGADTVNRIITKNIVVTKQQFRKNNNVISIYPDFTNTLIKNGIYKPYLILDQENNLADAPDTDIFYTSKKSRLLSREYTYQDLEKTQNNTIFSIGKFHVNTDNILPVQLKFINSIVGSLTQEEVDFISEFAQENTEIFNDLESQTFTSQQIDLPTYRYAAPTPNDCGYCAQYAWIWGAGTSFACDGSDGPVPDGFVLTSGVGTNNCGISASGELPFPPSFDDVPQYVKDYFVFETEFGGLINSVRRIAGETYDSQRLCDAYDLTAQSGLYEWQPANNLGLYSSSGVPPDYAFCSDEFYAF